MPMRLNILSPEEIIVDAPADSVRLVMESGAVGVLSGRSPLAGKIKRSFVKYSCGNKEERTAVEEGFAVVMPDRVTVFTSGKSK
jgi:F0F1-type ATP synthase epsilon subunit